MPSANRNDQTTPRHPLTLMAASEVGADRLVVTRARRATTSCCAAGC